MTRRSAQLPRTFLSLPRTGRTAALAALFLVDGGFPVQSAVDRALALLPPAGSADGESSAQRRLCADLAYGYLRMETRLSFVLGRVLLRPEALPRAMRLALGLAVYSLLCQERVPAHAVVHGTVSMVRSLFGQALSRVANGALRSVQRLGNAPRALEFYQKGGGARARLEALACYCSLPLWVVRDWERAYGRDAAELLLQRSSRRPWTAWRINAAMPGAALLRGEALAAGGSAVGSWGVAFAPGNVPEALGGRVVSGLVDAGALSLQAAGSLAVLHALGLERWEGAVWDACAGFGGKTLALLECGIGVRLATDGALERLSQLPLQCRRLGLAAPCVALADARRPPLTRWGGHILLDAPCSGLGVLSRRPDIRRRPRSGLAGFQRVQAELLAAVSGLLRRGNELAYITCTLRPEENEEAVARVLAARRQLELVAQWQTPHAHPWLEGMFGALLRCR